MSTWNHRVVCLRDEIGTEFLEIREVYYNDRGIPVGHTPAEPMAETKEDLLSLLHHFTVAVGHPTLDESEFIGTYEEH